jgi:hypothetical protein
MIVGPMVWGTLNMGMGELDESYGGTLTHKRRIPFFGPFLEFRQAIVDGIFVQKFSNFW